MSGQKEYGSLSSFGFFKALSSSSKQPPGRSLLTDVNASTEPVVVEPVLEPVATAAAAVEPLAAATEPSSVPPAAEAAREAAMREAAARGDLAFLAFVADQKAAAAATLLGGGVVSERDISLLNFGTLDASWDSISSFEDSSQNSNHSQGQVRHRTEGSVGAAAGASIHSDPEVATSSVEMRPGMRWLIESMNRTVLMFDADEDENDEDGMSIDWPEQHPDRNKAVDERVVPSRVHRFETVRERVTRARASLPRGLPKSVPGIFSAAKSLGKRPGELPPGLPPGLPPASAPNLPPMSPATSLVQDVRRCGGGATSSSSEPEEKVFVDHL